MNCQTKHTHACIYYMKMKDINETEIETFLRKNTTKRNGQSVKKANFTSSHCVTVDLIHSNCLFSIHNMK